MLDFNAFKKSLSNPLNAGEKLEKLPNLNPADRLELGAAKIDAVKALDFVILIKRPQSDQPGYAWGAFHSAADSALYTKSGRGRGRAFAVITFDNDAIKRVIITNSEKISALQGEKIDPRAFADAAVYHKGAAAKAEKPAAKTEEKPAKKAVKASQEKPVKAATKKPVKDTGFTAVALDRKDLQAPLSATKEKVVKALTTAPAATKKRPKSKSRARLDASRKAVKEWKGQPADFSDFVKVINAGRKAPYSARNCALLYDQSNGKATQVKGFQSWKAAGRVVKKGSKALVIEAPKIVKGTDKGGKEVEHLICTPVCVFDISQTEAIKEA